MPRIVEEQKIYSRATLETMARYNAKLVIVGSMYVGRFHGQTAEWLPDGSLRVVTEHEPSTLEDLRAERRRRA